MFNTIFGWHNFFLEPKVALNKNWCTIIFQRIRWWSTKENLIYYTLGFLVCSMHCFALFGTFKPLEKALGALITHLHVVDFHESSAKLSTATCLYPLNCIRLHRFGKLNYLVGRLFLKENYCFWKLAGLPAKLLRLQIVDFMNTLYLACCAKVCPLKPCLSI